ncbi:MAG: type II secretion system protein GspG [Planctomycetota bacterium]|nr:type II secretion system protein GspG [Planctomycetota bacterium]
MADEMREDQTIAPKNDEAAVASPAPAGRAAADAMVCLVSGVDALTSAVLATVLVDLSWRIAGVLLVAGWVSGLLAMWFFRKVRNRQRDSQGAYRGGGKALTGLIAGLLGILWLAAGPATSKVAHALAVGDTDDAAVQKTHATMELVTRALERYHQDKGEYPASLHVLHDLPACSGMVVGVVSMQPPGNVKDGFFHNMTYSPAAGPNGAPRLQSAGPDELFDTKDDIYSN